MGEKMSQQEAQTQKLEELYVIVTHRVDSNNIYHSTEVRVYVDVVVLQQSINGKFVFEDEVSEVFYLDAEQSIEEKIDKFKEKVETLKAELHRKADRFLANLEKLRQFTSSLNAKVLREKLEFRSD